MSASRSTAGISSRRFRARSPLRSASSPDLGREFLHLLAAEVRLHRPVLEGVEIPVERGIEIQGNRNDAEGGERTADNCLKEALETTGGSSLAE
ncbi:MAG: hypothetical protein ABIH42_02585 [Planctomycetota bacterium]